MASNRGKSRPLAETIQQANAEDTEARRGRAGVEAFAQLPEDAIIYIWRRDEASKEFANTGLTFAPDEFDVAKVKESLGGGVFQARAMIRDEQDRKIPAGQRQFRIEGAAKAFAGSGVAGSVPSLTAPVQTGTPQSSSRDSIIDMGIMSMFKQMQDNSQLQLAMVKDMLDSRKGGVDMAAILTAAVPLVTALITTLGNRKDPNEIAADLIEKIKPANNGMQDMLRMAETMAKLKELAGAGGGAEPEDVSTVALRTFGPVIAEMLTAKQQQTTQPVARIPAATPTAQIPANAVGADVKTTPPVPSEPEPMWVTTLRPHVKQLARIAASGRDAVDFAHSVIAFFMPEHHKGTVRELVLQENAAEQLLAAFPELAQYPVWVTEFVEGVRQELCPELYDEDDETLSPSHDEGDADNRPEA